MQSRSERRWSTRWCGFAHPLPAALRSPRTGPRHAFEVGSVVASGGSARNVRRAEATVDTNMGPISTTTSCPTSTRCAAIWTCDRRGLSQETSPSRSSPLRLLWCIGPPYNTARCRASVQHRAADRFACTSPTTVFHDGGTRWDARYPTLSTYPSKPSPQFKACRCCPAPLSLLSRSGTAGTPPSSARHLGQSGVASA